MTGAASLMAICCLRSGAGLVTLGTPVSCQPLVALAHPSLMTVPLPETASGHLALDSLQSIQHWSQKSDVVAAGPGWGNRPALGSIVRWMFDHTPGKLLLDADGLNCLASRWQVDDLMREKPPIQSERAPRVLTPHPGEFQRLWQSASALPHWSGSGQTAAKTTQRELMEQQAQQLAAATGCVILLKGARTLVTDGQQQYHNQTGNPGMATGGSGDCLTGILAAILAVMPTAYQATCLAAHVHGLAGDLAADALGPTAMTSADLADFLPQAWKSLGN